jgi:hypothetical protein
MTAADSSRLQVTVHLLQQSTVIFNAAHLWPMHGAYARFGNDLASLAEEVTRRLKEDGYVGFSSDTGGITVIPLAAVKRVDFGLAAANG